jgi:predicted  nucleic acid-binding Zn-ribbon protein
MPHECTNCGRVFADGSKEMLSGCPDCGGNKFQFRPAAATESSGTEATASTGDTPSGTTPSRGADESDSPNRDLSAGSREWPDHGYGSDDADAPDPSAPGAARSDPSSPDTTSAEPDAAGSGSDTTASTQPDGSPTPASDDPSTSAPGPERPTPPDTESGSAADSVEDPAQASARTDVVSPDEIASGAPGGANDPTDPPGRSGEAADAPPTDADGRVIEPTSDDRPDLSELREELNEQFESIRIVAPGEYELNLMELYDRTEYIISLQEDGRYVIEVPDTWDTTPDPDET